MNENFSLIEELFALCELKLEGKLSSPQLARLEQLIQSDAACRRAYVEYMHQHATLHWLVGTQSETSLEALDKMAGAPIPFPAPRHKHAALLALAASIIILLGIVILAQKPNQPPAQTAFATLVEAKNAHWGAGQLPTEIGSRLSPGRMRLIEGFAAIQFDNGTRVVVEAPADFHLLSPMECLLHEGVLIAKVSTAGKGFRVRTPTAQLTDYGTEFGVTANAKGETQVQVFEGIVDVERLGSGDTQRLFKGKNFRVANNQSAIGDVQNFEAQRPDASIQSIENTPGTITLTTAFGRGKDAYVQTEPSGEHGSDVLLLVKNANTESFRRKAYLAFDLAGIPIEKAEDAKLILTMAPSGYGYASFTPECTFTVYGLLEESRDDWREEEITWANAPANMNRGDEMDPAGVARIGSFKVAEGVSSGEFTVEGPALVEFLRKDHNGLATFIIVRETSETRGGSLVHGFISRRNPTGSPPTLRITLHR